jgi:hypothetical protein
MLGMLTNLFVGLALLIAGAAAVPLFPPLYRVATRLRSNLPFGNPAWITLRGGVIIGQRDVVPEDGRYELVPSAGEDD